MESSDEIDFKLEEQINKCRCCFRPLINEQNFSNVDEIIEERFQNLTQLNLISSEFYSKIICNLCDNDLLVFSNFRASLIEKQKRLYNIGAKLNIKNLDASSQFPIKTELADEEDEPQEDFFIDCTTLITDDLKQEVPEATLGRRKSAKTTKKKKEVEINDEEHQKLLDEFKVVLKEKKDKK